MKPLAPEDHLFKRPGTGIPISDVRKAIKNLCNLGMSRSEVRGLMVANFDFAKRTVRVQQNGGPLKTLPLNDEAIEAVRGLVEPKPLAPGDYLFKNPLTGEPITNVRKAISRICERAGVTKKVTPHLFRHSIATHLMGADVNMRTIQQYLGHSQISTTEFYTHVALGHLRQAQDVIPKPSSQ